MGRVFTFGAIIVSLRTVHTDCFASVLGKVAIIEILHLAPHLFALNCPAHSFEVLTALGLEALLFHRDENKNERAGEREDYEAGEYE